MWTKTTWRLAYAFVHVWKFCSIEEKMVWMRISRRSHCTEINSFFSFRKIFLSLPLSNHSDTNAVLGLNHAITDGYDEELISVHEHTYHPKGMQEVFLLHRWRIVFESCLNHTLLAANRFFWERDWRTCKLYGRPCFDFYIQSCW